MAVNISARNYQLVIGGLDCTKALKSVDGGFSHYDSTGLILISASLVLGCALNFNENLDDRSNPRWARGNIINLYIANSSGQSVAAPVIGCLYILKAEFDGISQLKIEAGCILNLLNFRTPAGDGACFDLERSVGLNEIASKLLNKAGAGSKWAGNLNGAPLPVPLPKLSNESYVQLFGKLCWANCFVAYQDNLGMIRTHKVSKAPASIKSLQVGVDDARYERLSGAESPVELVKVSGVLSTKKNTEPFTRSVDERYEIITYIFLGTVNNESRLMGRTIREESINFNSRKIIITTNAWDGAIIFYSGFMEPRVESRLEFSQKEIEENIYERTPPPSQREDNCQEPDEGRLLTKLIKIYQPLRRALADYFQARPNVIIQTPDELVLTKQARTTYNYNGNRINAVGGGANPNEDDANPSIIYEEFLIDGTIRPTESLTIANALKLKISKKKTTYWKKIRKDEWEIEETDYEGRANTLSAGNFQYTQNDQLYIKNKITRRSNSGQTTPPAPDRFPPKQEVDQKQIKKEVRLPALYGNPLFRPREKEIIIDGGLLTSEQQAYDLGLIEGHILWGRHKGQSCSVAVSDEWFGVAPLSGCWWRDISGASYLFMIDGLSIAFVNNCLALAFDGIWCGSVPANISQGQEYENLVPPYAQVFDVELGSASILESQMFPYSIELKTSDTKVFSQSGFAILTAADIRDVYLGSVSGFAVLTGADIRNVELGSTSGLSSTSPINVLLGGASGIFVLVAEGVQLGSFSQFDFATDSFDARVNLGSALLFEVELAPVIDVELGSSSQSDFDINNFDNVFELGAVSGLEVEVALSIDIELGSSSQLDFDINNFDNAFELGTVSGLEVEVAPDNNVELGSSSQFSFAVDEVDSVVELCSISGVEIEVAPEINVELGVESQFLVDINSFDTHVNLGLISGLFVEQAPRIDAELGSSSQLTFNVDSFDRRADLGSISGADSEMYASELVTHAGDTLLTSTNGARWVAYMPDMKHLALEPEAIIYRSNVILNGGSIPRGDLIGINAFVQEMKAANLWDKCLEIYPFAGNDLVSARVKLKSSSQVMLGVSGLINFDKYYGIFSSGGFLLTGINPNNKMIENNLHLSIFIQLVNSQQTSGGWLLGAFNSLSQALGIQRNPNLSRFYSGGNRNTNLRNINRKDFFVASRIPALSLFKFSDFASSVTASTLMPLPNAEIALLARNNNGSYDSISPDTVAFSSIGYGLSLVEIIQFEYIVRNLLYSLGRI